MNAITPSIAFALMQSLWQDAIVAVALWLALRLLRRRSSNLRYVVSCAALAMMVLWPVLSSVSIGAPVPVTRASSQTPPTVTSVAVPEAVRSTWNVVMRADTPVLAPFQRWVIPIWLFGVMLFSLRAVGSATHAALLARRGTPADPALTALVAAVATRLGVARSVRV